MAWSTGSEQPGVCLGAGEVGMSSLRARDFMRYGVVSIGKDESICQAVKLLLEKHVSGLAVTQEGRVEGILTEKDILRGNQDPSACGSTAQDHMTEKVVTFDQGARLWDVCECLITHHFRRVPILSQERLVGIVSRADVIRKMTAVFKRSAEDR